MKRGSRGVSFNEAIRVVIATKERDAKRAELFQDLVNALSELYAVTPSTAPGVGLEGAKERHAAACKLAVDVLIKSKALS